MLLTRKIIAVKAFDMFKNWTKNAKLIYPKLDFTIIDETSLVQDLIKSITDAKDSLFKEEKKAAGKEGIRFRIHAWLYSGNNQCAMGK